VDGWRCIGRRVDDAEDEEGLVMEEVRAGSKCEEVVHSACAIQRLCVADGVSGEGGRNQREGGGGLMKAGGGAEREVVTMVGVGGWPGVAVAQTRVISGGDTRQQMMWKKNCGVRGDGGGGCDGAEIRRRGSGERGG